MCARGGNDRLSSVDSVYYHYPDGTEALRSISFDVEPGECVALIGPNGAGKSTLLLHLNGLLPDDSHAKARCTLMASASPEKNLESIRRKVGLLFQDPDDQLFCPTVFEDVAFAHASFGHDPAQLKKIVADALAMVD